MATECRYPEWFNVTFCGKSVLLIKIHNAMPSKKILWKKFIGYIFSAEKRQKRVVLDEKPVRSFFE